MSLFGFLLLVIIAAVCGSLGQSLAGYSLGGCLVSAVVGLIGAYIGYWVADRIGLPPLLTVNVDGQAFPIVWSIIGSAIFALVVGVLRRRAYR